MKRHHKELLIGFMVGLIATSFGCFIFIEFFSQYDFVKTIEFIKQGNLESKVIVLGAIANFFVFFVFLKKKQIMRARGVLLETVFIAFLTLIMSLLSN